MIKLTDLTKKYMDVVAVDNLNLSIRKGEIFGFIGPNGAGKTTTIKMMGGILAPTAGKIEIGHIDLLTEPEKAKRKIGFIPDRPYIYEKLTGMEFLRFSADLYGVSETVFAGKAEEYLKMFSLWEWSNKLVESYSHGMKQRLIMAAALLHGPEVIIVDEPMVGLDPSAIKMVKELFNNMAAEGVTLFISTHTLKVAEDVCQRVGIIDKGSIIALGTIEELKENVKSTTADLEEVFMQLTLEDNT